MEVDFLGFVVIYIVCIIIIFCEKKPVFCHNLKKRFDFKRALDNFLIFKNRISIFFILFNIKIFEFDSHK